METVDARRKEGTVVFRLPVQGVCRPNQNFRGFAGTVTGGAVAIGEEIAVLPSGQRSKVAAIITADGELERAIEGQAVTLTLDDEIDASRGDVIAAGRSEEHTSELPSLMRISYAVFCLTKKQK